MAQLPLSSKVKTKPKRVGIVPPTQLQGVVGEGQFFARCSVGTFSRPLPSSLVLIAQVGRQLLRQTSSLTWLWVKNGNARNETLANVTRDAVHIVVVINFHSYPPLWTFRWDNKRLVRFLLGSWTANGCRVGASFSNNSS